jgi:hypothetical protein
MDFIKLKVCNELILVERQRLLSKSHYFQTLVDGPFLKADVDGVIELQEKDAQTFKHLMYYIRENTIPEHVFNNSCDFSRFKEMASFYLIDLWHHNSQPKFLHNFCTKDRFTCTQEEYDIYMNALWNKGVGRLDHLYHLIGKISTMIIFNKDFEKAYMRKWYFADPSLNFFIHILSYNSIHEMEAKYPGFGEKFHELA